MPRSSSQKASSHRFVVLLGVLLLVFLSVAQTALASNRSVDLTVAATYQFGGSFELEDFEFGLVDIEVDDSDGVAVFLGIPISRSLQVELIGVRQQTSVSIDEGRFTQNFVIGDLDLDYYHLGLLWQFAIGQIEPYIALSGGITQFNFDIPGVGNDSFPSVSIGGGFKARLSQHVGLRFDGRFFVTDLDPDIYDEYDYCDRRCSDGESMVQGFVSAGILFSF